jgi:hypothetical protein
LRAVGWPVVFVVECSRIPDCFEEDLGEADGVCRRAGAAGFEGAGGGVCDVFAMNVSSLYISGTWKWTYLTGG